MTSFQTRPTVSAEGRWTDDAVETLKRLWAEPDLSAAMIARRLGVSRNAVLGKIHRLGLSKPRTPRRTVARRIPQGPRPPRQAPAPGRARPGPIPRARAALEVGPGLVARLEDLSPRACRWPLGDPKAADFAFCGRAVEQRPYCGAHAAVAFRGRGGGVAELARLLRR